MAVDFTEFKAQFAAYRADVLERLKQERAGVDKIVAEAIAKDDAGEKVELDKLLDDIKAARAEVVPPFTPSNN